MNTKKSGQFLFLLMISPIFIIGLIIYWLIANTPPEEKARNKHLFAQQKVLAQEMWQKQKEQEERNRLDIEGRNIQPNEKLPIYDSKKYGLIKIDYRYFLVPREYWSSYGFDFFWPTSLQHEYSTAIYKNQFDIEKRNKAVIEVFIESKYYSISTQIYRDLSSNDSCYQPRGTTLRWNGLIIWPRFDDGFQKDWPAICKEIVHILNLVKEVKQ